VRNEGDTVGALLADSCFLGFAEDGDAGVVADPGICFAFTMGSGCLAWFAVGAFSAAAVAGAGAFVAGAAGDVWMGAAVCLLSVSGAVGAVISSSGWTVGLLVTAVGFVVRFATFACGVVGAILSAALGWLDFVGCACVVWPVLLFLRGVGTAVTVSGGTGWA
jgi:hypothetical protein